MFQCLIALLLTARFSPIQICWAHSLIEDGRTLIIGTGFTQKQAELSLDTPGRVNYCIRMMDC